jgi:L-malate glycosyltransferase
MSRPHLCHVFPAFATGGPEVRTSLLIDASEKKFKHTIISLSGVVSGRERIQRATDVEFISPRRTGSQFANALALCRVLKTMRPDLVLTYGWGGTDAVAVARLAGFHRVIHAEDGFLPDEAQCQKRKRVWVRRFVFRLPARFVVPSRTLVRIANDSWSLSGSRVRYLPNGVDTNHFTPPTHQAIAAARQRLGFRPEETVVGTVGHLRAEKNQQRLLRAFASVAATRPARLLILGDGPLRETLVEQARALGIADSVTFTGVVSDPAQYYPAMDGLAMSSDTEQMPIAVLEAMSMGLPVVSTDVGDVKEMLSAENRDWVTPLGADDAFARSLAAQYDDAGERRRRGMANREKCLREFDLQKMIDEYVDLYREVLEI